ALKLYEVKKAIGSYEIGSVIIGLEKAANPNIAAITGSLCAADAGMAGGKIDVKTRAPNDIVPLPEHHGIAHFNLAVGHLVGRPFAARGLRVGCGNNDIAASGNPVNARRAGAAALIIEDGEPVGFQPHLTLLHPH